MIKANISWSVKQIAKAVDNGSMMFDNAIQRGEVWDVARKCLLVDSILRGYPVPPMYTIKTDMEAPESCKKGSKIFDCIDGKQRCTTLRDFRNNKFKLENLNPLDDFDFNGKTYSELPEEIRDIFDDYTLTVYFFTAITDDEVCEMMSRLNNGKALTGIENARIKSKELATIKRLASHKLFTENMTVTALKGYNNEDLVLKSIIEIVNNKHDLATKNVKMAYEILSFENGIENKMTEIYNKTYSVVSELKTNAEKSIISKAIKKTSLLDIIVFISNNTDEDTHELAQFVYSFFDKNENKYKSTYASALCNGTNHAVNVSARNSALQGAYNEYNTGKEVK